MGSHRLRRGLGSRDIFNVAPEVLLVGSFWEQGAGVHTGVTRRNSRADGAAATVITNNNNISMSAPELEIVNFVWYLMKLAMGLLCFIFVIMLGVGMMLWFYLPPDWGLWDSVDPTAKETLLPADEPEDETWWPSTKTIDRWCLLGGLMSSVIGMFADVRMIGRFG